MEKSVADIVASMLNDDESASEKTAISSETQLIATGLLNSLAIVRLVSELESAYSIRVPFREVIKENFVSISAIESLVHRIQNQKTL